MITFLGAIVLIAGIALWANEITGLGIFIFILGLIIFISGIVMSFHSVALVDYSDGERTGLITKLSYKGTFCKTWEGHMLVGNGNNVAPENFNFTVKDKTIADQINAKSGVVATLSYKEYLYTTPCFGETDYSVTAVK